MIFNKYSLNPIVNIGYRYFSYINNKMNNNFTFEFFDSIKKLISSDNIDK